MVIISSAELRCNLKKYLDTAIMETVVIHRGKKETFVLQRHENLPEISSEIPNDFHKAITGKELRANMEVRLREMIKNPKFEKYLD